MQQRLHGFVLGWTELSANRLIVDLFSQENGALQGVARFNAQTSRSFLAPLTLVTFHLQGRENQHLKQLVEVGIDSHCFDLVSNYLGLTLASHWCWLIKQTQPADHPDAKVFRLLEHVVDSIRLRPVTADELQVCNLYFEIWLLHFCGVLGRHLPREFLDSSELDPAERLNAQLDRDLLSQVFQRKIEEYLPNALKLGVLDRSAAVLGTLWERHLGRDLKTRQLFYKQLKVRGAVT